MQRTAIDDSLARKSGLTQLEVASTLDGEEALMDYEVVGGVCQLKAGKTAGRVVRNGTVPAPGGE
tara:strand:+ start:6560 stop:6754 length:195 start_codon:yes stop_codon:yes gene_type:complete